MGVDSPIYPAWATARMNRDDSAKSQRTRAINNLIGTVKDSRLRRRPGTIDAFDSGVVTEVGQWMARHPDAITGERAPDVVPRPQLGQGDDQGNDLTFPSRGAPARR